MKCLRLLLAACLGFGQVAWAADDLPRYKAIPSLGWSLDRVVDVTSAGTVTGTNVAFTDLDCTVYTNGGSLTTDVNGNIFCADDDGGGSSVNSFSTIAVPAGTNPVADSSSDTLNITETSFLTLTGTAATDTIDITQVTTDLGTDGLIAANAVALGADTTNAYVADLTAGTAIDVSGGGGETATITVDVDPTEIEAVTFGAGGNASNLWTVNLSGTDPTLLWGSALATLTGSFASTNTVTGVVTEFDGANGNVSINAHNVTGNYTLLLPPNDGDADQVLTTNGTGHLRWASGGVSGGDSITVNSSAATDPNFADGDVDWTLTGGNSITATVACTGCVNTTDILDATVASGDLASGALPPYTLFIPCVALLPLETSDVFAPPTKDAGTNIDQLPCAFDADADNGRTGVFKVPSRIEAGSTVTMTVHWYSAAATTGAAVWDIRHNSGTAGDIDPDVALTTETATDTTAGTAGQVSFTAITETQTNLAWAAGDLVYFVLYRDANAAGDTLAGDALVIGVSIEIPLL